MNTTGTGSDEKANYVIVVMEVSDGAKVPSTSVRAKLSEFKAISEMVPSPHIIWLFNHLILLLIVEASRLQELYSWGAIF